MNTIPAKAVIYQVQLANIIPKLYAPVGCMSTEANQEEDGSWILQQLDLGGLQKWIKEQQQTFKIFYVNQLIDYLK